jgi:glycosyltransferase involved in cell wall biosynthesis
MTVHLDHDSFSVSVVIPAYNAQQYIARAIRSVLAQTFAPTEIIVVDDGSTDKTADVVKSFGPAVRYLHQANAGAAAARNHGINAATCEWVAFLDADDEWLPEKLERQRELWRRCPNLAWIGANYYCHSDLTGRRQPRDAGDTLIRFMNGKDYFDDYFAAYARGVWSWTGTLLIQREVLIQVGLFDERFRPGAEDTDLWWRIAYQHPNFGYVPDPLAVYHLEAGPSLTTHRLPIDIPFNLVSRHLALAAGHNRLQAFRPAAAASLRMHIRSMLFESRSDDIHRLVGEFKPLFPLSFRILMRMLTLFPNATATLCFGISRFLRFFNLRRRVVPHPRRLKSGGEQGCNESVEK